MMWCFIASLIIAQTQAQVPGPVCKSTGTIPIMVQGGNGGPFSCSARFAEALSCPMGSACENINGLFFCCPYGNITCNRFTPAPSKCERNTALPGQCEVTLEYGCMEKGSGATVIDAPEFMSGTCFKRCGVMGWQRRGFGAPNPNTACWCTKDCWRRGTCCADYSFYCAFLKEQGYLLYPSP